MDRYWDLVRSRRIARRRILSASLAAGGAALLAACGGGDDESGVQQAASGLISPVTDDTKNLKRGGIIKSSQPVPLGLDPHQVSAGVVHVWHNYSPLFKVVDGHLARASGEMDGEVIDSWELSPDKLILTAKVTKDVGFAPVAPVNGRAVDAQDIAFSWKRYTGVSPRAGELANDANASAPIVSITAIDNQTISIKLKEPVSTILAQLAATFPGVFFVVPREAENPSVMDLKQVSAGSGPFYASNIVQSAMTTYKRNPAFKKDKRGVPYVDQIDYADLPEYSAQLAQLKAGHIYDNYFNFRAEDILPTKKDVPDLEITPAPIVGLILRALFGSASDSQFKDERVRQALVLTWDRDLLLDVAYNVSKFRDGGLPVETAVESGVQSGAWTGWWLDPRGKDFGPNSKFFKHDIAEAKKLMSAAGLASGIDMDMYYVSPQPYANLVEILIGFARDSGLFRISNKVMSSSEFNATFRTNRGNFKGAGFITDNIEAHPLLDLVAHYHSKNGGRFFGGDSRADDMLNEAVREFDVKKQQQLVHELQRYEGSKFFQPRLGGGNASRIAWPALRNKGVWQGSLVRWFATHWLDPAKPPLSRS